MMRETRPDRGPRLDADFRLLGPVEVVAGGRAIELGGPKQRALLALLVMHANEVVSRDLLIDELWGEHAPESAGHSIVVYVSRLRKALRASGIHRAPAIATEAGGYVLRVDPARIDVKRFERALEQGGRALAAGAVREAADLLRGACDAWRGEPLSDLADEPFAEAEALRLQELRLAALGSRIDADLLLGRHAELVAELESLVRRNPLDERLCGQLMVALYRSGRQARALEVYQATRRSLDEELGIEPDENLERLQRAILRHDRDLEPPTVARSRAVDGVARRPGPSTPVATSPDPAPGAMGAATSLLARALDRARPKQGSTNLEVDLSYAVRGTAPHRAVAISKAAAAQAHEAGNESGEALALVARADHQLLIGEGDVDELEALAYEALPSLAGVGDQAGLARVWGALGFGVANVRCRFEEMTEAAEQALRHAGLEGQRPGGPLEDRAMGLACGPRAADDALRALDARLPDSPTPWLLMWRAYLLAMLDRLDEAQPGPRRLCELMREMDVGPGEGMVAMIATLQGDHETAASYLRTMCDILDERGLRGFLSGFAPELSRSLCALGRYDEAEPLAQLGRELGDPRDVSAEMLWRQAQALVDAHRGRHDEAERLVRVAIAIGEQSDSLNLQADARFDLGEVLRAAGRTSEAAGAFREALDRYERKRNLPMARRVRAILEGISPRQADL